MANSNGIIVNGDVISCGEVFPKATLEIQDGRIHALHQESRGAPDLPVLWDATECQVLPGFIDIHTHGAAGRDVCDGRPGALREIGRAKIREGVTTFLPTTLTLAKEDLRRAATHAADYMREPEFAKAPRLHIEGPYINPKAVGAQNPAFVRPPNIEEILTLNEIAPVGIVSLAPELEGSLEFIAQMKERAITTSIAHTAATYDQVRAAREAGATHLTHYCNQMTPIHHREIGVVGAALLDDEVMIEMICDRIHLCDEMIQLVLKHRDLANLMLVTDSVAPSWMPEGPFEIGGLKGEVKDGAARLSSGALAGSTLRFHHALRNVASVTGKSVAELSALAGANQARSLGLEGLGEIREGYAADLVVLDGQCEPKAVFVNGENLLPDANAAAC